MKAIVLLLCFTADVNPCYINPHPCKLGWTCFRLEKTQDYVCACRPGYTGNYCDTGVLQFFFKQYI